MILFLVKYLGAETHSQTLGKARETLQKRGGRIVGTKDKCGPWPQNPLGGVHRGSQSLKGQTQTLNGSEQGPLHIPLVV